MLKENNKTKTPQVIVTGFITSGEYHDGSVKNPMPDDYLEGCKDMPQELIDTMKKSGWMNGDNVCFPKNFLPKPVKGEDGNVYLCVNDSTMSNQGKSISLMIESTMMLGI